MPEKICCTQCGREKAEKEYFMMKSHERYPVCKACLTAFIDNNDANTFKWILEKFDVPYIETVWNDEAQKAYEKNPAKFGSASVIGRYLRLMNMQQYRNYTYADTVKIALENEKKQQEAQARVMLTSEDAQEEFMQLQARLDAGEITQAEFDTLNPLTRGQNTTEKTYTFNQSAFVNEDDILAELTQEDRRNLSLKWGLAYHPSEWVRMEEMYTKYANEYELNVDREETLKQICKLALKMDQALDVGDASTYKSLQTAYDSLRKSAKFTEAQNKEESVRYLDSIGELVRFCEKEGGIIAQIPHPDDYPQDKIDFCIKDMKQYMYNLVTKELGLGNLIESYIEKLEKQEEDKKNADTMMSDNFILSTEQEESDAVTDQEAEEFYQYLENELEEEARKLAAGDI